VLFGVIAGRGPGRVARSRFKSLEQFAANENFHLRWVPHQLTDNLRQVRVAKCYEFLPTLEAVPRTHFRHIIAGDESWFYLEYQHTSQWPVSPDEVT
jgi:hypothetical protein